MSVATASVEAPASTVEVIGRLAVVEGELTTVTAERAGEVFTASEPGVGRPADEVVTIPLLGERVVVTTRDDAVCTGYWLGVISGDRARPGDRARRVLEYDGLMTVLILGETMQEVRVKPEQVEASKVVSGRRAEERERRLLGSLLDEVLAHRVTRREHEAWRERLVECAHQEADDREWCPDFDDFMADMGLPRRTRDYDLKVTLPEMTLYFTREGTDAENAGKDITRDDILEAIKPEIDTCGWEAAEDY